MLLLVEDNLSNGRDELPTSDPASRYLHWRQTSSCANNLRSATDGRQKLRPGTFQALLAIQLFCLVTWLLGPRQVRQCRLRSI